MALAKNLLVEEIQDSRGLPKNESKEIIAGFLTIR